MNAKAAKVNLINWLLIFLLLMNIIGDFGNIFLWYISPPGPASLQLSLRMGIIASALGGDNALLVGTIILTVVACAFIMAMFGVFKKQKWGPMMTIGTTILNRAAALFIFIIAVYQFPWVVWTIILVAVSYLDYRRLR